VDALLPSGRIAARRTAMARDGSAQVGDDDAGTHDNELGDRGFQQAAKLPRKIDRHARVHGTLLVEKALGSARREYALVPDVRMDVEAAATIEAEADEIRGLHVVAG